MLIIGQSVTLGFPLQSIIVIVLFTRQFFHISPAYVQVLSFFTLYKVISTLLVMLPYLGQDQISVEVAEQLVLIIVVVHFTALIFLVKKIKLMYFITIVVQIFSFV